jgi:hypothetical protein
VQLGTQTEQVLTTLAEEQSKKKWYRFMGFFEILSRAEDNVKSSWMRWMRMK